MEHVIGISMLYQWLKMSVMNIPFNLEYPFVDDQSSLNRTQSHARSIHRLKVFDTIGDKS